MDWVDGDPLNGFVEKHLKDKNLLLDLSDKFCVMVKQLRDSHIAHGDLQHGNILITTRLEIKLIDYDGMYIPPFKGQQSMELGHYNYQHILRNPYHFDENLDNFSAIVIYLSLRAIAMNPTLFKEYNNVDKLIFEKRDFVDPKNSRLINIMKNSNDRITKHCTNILISNINKNPSTFPNLEYVLKSI
jgi:hypothetical protein